MKKSGRNEFEREAFWTACYGKVKWIDRPKELKTSFEKHFGYRWKPDVVDIVYTLADTTS